MPGPAIRTLRVFSHVLDTSSLTSENSSVMSKVPCFLCQSLLEIRTSKKEKPYLVCDDCGIQVFFRLPKGIRRLQQLRERAGSLADKYVLCHRCRVAVEKCVKNYQEGWSDEDGLYCPRCEELLLEISREELERR